MPQAWLGLFTKSEQALITASRHVIPCPSPILLPNSEAMTVISKLAALMDTFEAVHLTLPPPHKDEPT